MQQKQLDQDKYNHKQLKMYTARKKNLEKISTTTSKFEVGFIKRLNQKRLLDLSRSKEEVLNDLKALKDHKKHTDISSPT